MKQLTFPGDLRQGAAMVTTVTTIKLTLADVIAYIGAIERPTSCTQRSKNREIISALRTVSRLIGMDPSRIPADPRFLRDHLAFVSRASQGLTRGRWANIRSLALAGLAAAGIAVMPGRSSLPLSAAWQTLRGYLPDANFRHGLSRFMSFCSTKHVEPGEVTGDTFRVFREALDNDSLVKKPRLVFRTACVLWNKALDGIGGWPGRRVEVPNGSRRYALYWEEFPVPFQDDAAAFLHSKGNQDPFADDYAPSVKPSTTAMRRKQILQMASVLVQSGVAIESITSLAVLVQVDNATRLLRLIYQRAGNKTTKYLHQQALLLKTIARHWVKVGADQVAHLGEFGHNLAPKRSGMTEKNRMLLRQFDNLANVDALIGLPNRVLRRVNRGDRGLRRDASDVALALAVEVLLAAPVRVDNLTGLEIDRHIQKLGGTGTTLLCIPFGETKTDAVYEMELPAESVAFLAAYLRDYRPRLAAAPGPWLFPNPDGERRHTAAFSTAISQFILRETGLRMNVHLFRHLAVKLYLAAHPDDIETARLLLGHSSSATTTKAYAEGNNATAFKRYDAMLAGLRERARARSPGGNFVRGGAR